MKRAKAGTSPNMALDGLPDVEARISISRPRPRSANAPPTVNPSAAAYLTSFV